MVNASVYVALGGLAITYVFVSFFILPMFSTQQKYLSQQEWVGVEKGFFARFRAGMAAIKNTPALVREGYSKVCHPLRCLRTRARGHGSCLQLSKFWLLGLVPTF
jgi:hypothetical protein